MINVEQVTRVYSGKPGCMCGCRGKYWEAAISPVMVKKVVKLINDNGGKIDDSGEWADVEIDGRSYVAYLGARS